LVFSPIEELQGLSMDELKDAVFSLNLNAVQLRRLCCGAKASTELALSARFGFASHSQALPHLAPWHLRMLASTLCGSVR
jgi:hypothetical protein